jgi:glutamyl-tRNA reductase
MRPEEIGGVRELRSCAVIATADLSEDYKAALKGALLRLEPRIIVDLSSIPVLSKCAVPKLNYVTMYDQAFLRLIDLNNQHLVSKLPLLLSDIERTLPTAEVS